VETAPASFAGWLLTRPEKAAGICALS